MRSVASFFVSRIDSEADKRLEELGADDLKGRLAIANAKIAYQIYKQVFGGSRWRSLEERGANRQRLLWASTSTKNPDYPDTLYVDNLVGPQTVNTMPKQTIEAVKDHGNIRPTLEEGVEEAKELERLREAGLDYEDVTDTLEQEGIQKFADPFHELLEEIKNGFFGGLRGSNFQEQPHYRRKEPRPGFGLQRIAQPEPEAQSKPEARATEGRAKWTSVSGAWAGWASTWRAGSWTEASTASSPATARRARWTTRSSRGAESAYTVEEMVEKLNSPRVLWSMLPAGT